MHAYAFTRWCTSACIICTLLRHCLRTIRSTGGRWWCLCTFHPPWREGDMHIACACFSDFQSGYLVMEGFRKFLRFLRSFCWICNILCNIYMHSLFILPKITLSRVSINKKNVTDLNLVQFGEQGMRLCSFPKKKKKKKRKKV